MGARGRTFGAGLIAIAVCALAPAAQAAEPRDPFYGVVVQHGDLSETELTKMERADVGTVRFLVPWAQIEPVEGDLRFDRLDERLAEIEEIGAAPLPVLYGRPGWLGDGNGRRPPLEDDAARAAWQELLFALGERYGHDGELATADPAFRPVDRWQVWNEPNLPSFWFGEEPTAAHYVDLLQISTEALRAADPESRIIAAGLSPAPKGVPPRRYLREMYAEYERLGAEPDFDELALNPYAPSVRESREQVGKFSRLAARLEPLDPPDLSISEIGWGSSGPKRGLVSGTRKTQSRRLRRAYRILRAKREEWRISSVLWYAWKDLPEGTGCVICDYVGLFNAEGKAKPAFKAFRDMNR